MDGRPTYWLTRFLILRLLGAIYAVAFLAAINQVIPLIGANGLLPVGIFLKRVGEALGSQPGRLPTPAIAFLVRPFRHGSADCGMDRIPAFLRRGGRLRQCTAAHRSLVSLYVLR